jgi:hypothetical protein
MLSGICGDTRGKFNGKLNAGTPKPEASRLKIGSPVKASPNCALPVAAGMIQISDAANKLLANTIAVALDFNAA